MDTNTVQVINAFGEKLDSYLNVLAEKAGVAADHFYPIFVQQQRLEGLTDLVFFLIMLGVLIFCLVICVKSLAPSWDNSDEDKQNMAATKLALSGVVVLVLIIRILVFAHQDGGVMVGKIFNPEYAAVQSLVQMTR